MGPTSVFLIVLLLGVCTALLVLLVRLRHWALRAFTGALVVLVAMVTGIAEVNDHYGYYRSWTSLFADLTGSQSLELNGGRIRVGNDVVVAGVLKQITLPGSRSHIQRPGLIYLPPQYGDRKFNHVRFPVVELLHGSPGTPMDWPRTLGIVKIAAVLIARHLMGPVVLVMPTINGSHGFEECVNGAGAADDTYIAMDVPAYVRGHYRVSSDPTQWGIGGYSSGGYCAANLGLRHRGSFGAVGIMDGYYRAADGPAAARLGGDIAAQVANSPLDTARMLPAGTAPLPAFWITAGTGNRFDFLEAEAFVMAMRPLEQVSFVVQRGANHDFYAVSAALPSMLAWMWLQLAPTNLRTAFPIVGPPTSVQVPPVFHPHRGQLSPHHGIPVLPPHRSTPGAPLPISTATSP